MKKVATLGLVLLMIGSFGGVTATESTPTENLKDMEVVPALKDPNYADESVHRISYSHGLRLPDDPWDLSPIIPLEQHEAVDAKDTTAMVGYNVATREVVWIPSNDTTQQSVRTACDCNKAEGEISVGVRNPAAVYCMEMGYEYKIEKTENGERGICVMPNNEECDAWAFYSGECGREFSYCAKMGWSVASKGEKDSFATNCTACVLPDGSSKTVAGLLNLSEKCAVGMKKVDENKMFSDTGLNEKDIKFKEKKISLPNYFDWRNKDGKNWMTPVRNQGSCGSCWAFSAVGIVEPVYNLACGNTNLDLDLSEQYLVSGCCINCGNCKGGWPATALRFIRDEGITDEACFPYIASNCPCSDRCSDWSNRLKKIDETASVPSNIGAIKESLIEKGPLSVVMGIGSKYGGHFDNNGIYRCTEDCGANHAVVIAGYDETEDYWIVRNSWGSSWNGDGYFKVGYGECSIEKKVYYVYYAELPNKIDLVIDDKWEKWDKKGKYRVYFVIKNIGTAKAPKGHTARLFVDGNLNPIDTKVIKKVLKPGKTYKSSFKTRIQYSGDSDTINVCADIFDDVKDELDEDNNCLENNLKCKKPDLVIEKKWEKWNKKGDKYTVHFVIKNVGDATAPKGHTAGLYVDGDLNPIDTKVIKKVLKPGKTYKGSFKTRIQCSGDSDTINVCADINNAVVESDELNNCKENEWTC